MLNVRLFYKNQVPKHISFYLTFFSIRFCSFKFNLKLNLKKVLLPVLSSQNKFAKSQHITKILLKIRKLISVLTIFK